MVLDTKYKEAKDKPDESEVAQMVLYSVSTGLKRCVLIYTGKSGSRKFDLKEEIQLYSLSLDMDTPTRAGFESLCTEFVQKIETL